MGGEGQAPARQLRWEGTRGSRAADPSGSWLIQVPGTSPPTMADHRSLSGKGNGALPSSLLALFGFPCFCLRGLGLSGDMLAPPRSVGQLRAARLGPSALAGGDVRGKMQLPQHLRQSVG